MCCNNDGSELGGWSAAVEPAPAPAPAAMAQTTADSHFGVHSPSSLMLLILLGVALGLYLRKQGVL